MLEAPDCDDTGDDCIKNCCANTAIAPLYFISFCLVSTFVMLNLVIAVLMAELESAEDEAVDFEDEFEEEENVLAAKEEEKQDEGKGPAAAKQDKKQIETLEAELAAALAQQEDRSESPTSAPALPPLPLHSPPKVSSNPTTPGRPR